MEPGLVAEERSDGRGGRLELWVALQLPGGSRPLGAIRQQINLARKPPSQTVP